MSDLEARIDALEERNRKVEAAKAWEVSWTRRALVAAITYVVACGLMMFLGAENWPLAAIMPVAGYLLSTLAIPSVRERWLAKSRST